MPRTSHRFIFRLLLAQMALALVLSLPVDAQAQRGDRGQGYGYGQGNSGDYGYGQGNSSGWDYSDQGGYNQGPIGQGRIVRLPINRTLYSRSTLSIEQELRLPYGATLLSLSVTAQALTRMGASIQLLEDGRSSGYPTQLSSYSAQVPLLLPYGRNMGRLEILAQGDIFVQEIVAEIEDSYNPGPGPGPGPIGRDRVELFVNQRILGSGTLHILQIAQQQREQIQGMDLLRVVVQGRSIGRFAAQARLIINGQPVSEFKSLDGGMTPFPVDRILGGRSEIGREIRQLQLEVRGDAMIDSMTLRLDNSGGYNPGPGPGPIPSRDLRLSPMRDFNGRISQSLMSALSLPSQYSDRLVSAITIDATSFDRGGMALVDTGRGPIQQISVNRYSAPVRVQLPRPIPLRDVGINMTGQIRIETIVIEFQY
ncbi:MAG: hypothetical protein K2P81_02885 [Bacteriovoracaceae bacterium]|nr:hypothetical protein [Bacteriovoracaceae bacterium]